MGEAEQELTLSYLLVPGVNPGNIPRNQKILTMCRILAIVLVLFTTIGTAQEARLYAEQDEFEFKVYADNSEFCPVSIKVDFDAINMGIEGGNHKTYVVPAREEKVLITKLTITDRKKAAKFNYSYTTNYGDINLNNTDEFIYDLPFRKSQKFKVMQGYNGTFSHADKYALDFEMPLGTEIMTMREGIVIEVIDLNSKTCPEKECVEFNNQIIVYHPDGTFAEYVHIKQNSSKVRKGESVVKGQVIAESGNVGWSTGPHLHISIFKQKLAERNTIMTKFKIGDGSNAEYLIENNEYTKGY